MGRKSKQPGEYSGNKASKTSGFRAGRWAAAIKLRELVPKFATQAEVARALGVTAPAIEQTELRALTKILEAFRGDLKEERRIE
jgi:hypothetical protein